MRVFSIIVIILLGAVLLHDNAYAQNDAGPVKIKINRIVFERENSYALYVPSFEFHVFFQQEFNILRSAITADYDYRRQDMGFGMSHAFYKYIVTPGITIEDNLYFREVFSDSTGIWNRAQSITPFLSHKVNGNTSVGMEFKIQREWSPNRRMGAQIINSQDRSLKIYYLYKKKHTTDYEQFLGYLSFERAYQIFNGDFNYLLLELFVRQATELNKSIRFKNVFSYKGNLTPQTSPLIFLGGHSNLIGYENDEFWGKKVFYMQNLLELKPFPNFEFSINKAQFRRLALLCQFDIGQVRGAPDFADLKPQNMDIKMGGGIGFGVNTDLPYMPQTDLHIMIASPVDRSDLKFYAGFGGWIK
ncbi:MAG: hypothetical protein JXB48_09825 [Candidatus Latescibacteria bacterium]|nr:hypothetical protein [Candidatus Latescibacterota bacterium]